MSRTSPTKFVVSVCLALLLTAGCKTEVDRQWERDIEAKKLRLADLQDQLVDLGDQLDRQHALLRVERAQLDAAESENRITAADRRAAEDEQRRSEVTLASLRARKEALDEELRQLSARQAEGELAAQRRRQILEEIAQVQSQISVLEKAMRERAAMRAKRLQSAHP